MAKKITLSNEEAHNKACAMLRTNEIDFVDVRYPKRGKEPTKFFIVVRNVMKTKVLSLLKNVKSVKSVRHYESLAIRFNYYEPTFDCKCRYCGKTFTSNVKEAVWCSEKCKKDFRNKKKAV